MRKANPIFSNIEVATQIYALVKVNILEKTV